MKSVRDEQLERNTILRKRLQLRTWRESRYNVDVIYPEKQKYIKSGRIEKSHIEDRIPATVYMCEWKARDIGPFDRD